MVNKITIEPLGLQYAPALAELWGGQFLHFCSGSPMYPYWENNTGEIAAFIREHAGAGRGVTASAGGRIVGYLAYDTFKFHGAESAFIPFAGNAAVLEKREKIYLAMYREIARKWVDEGIKNHYFTISAADTTAKNALFDMGFGSYVVDCCAKPSQYTNDGICTITKASPDDGEELYGLVKESRGYYAQSPIFLRMEEYDFDDLERLITTGHVFIAKHSGMIVGFVNLSIAEEDDIFRMCAKGFGRLNEIGAYIREDYRNRGVGRQLVKAVNDFCLQNEVPCIHVDFESANLYAGRFWPKYFDPAMLSVKRTVHFDI